MSLTITHGGNSVTPNVAPIRHKGVVLRVEPTLDTNAYADNDVLFLTTEISNAVASQGGVSKLISLSVHGLTADALDMDVIFMQKDVDLTDAVNEPVANGSTWTDTLARGSKLLGFWKVDGNTQSTALINNVLLTSGAGTEGNNQADAGGPGLLWQAEDNSTSIYFSAILRDTTPTYAIDGLEFIFNVEYL